MKSIKLLLSILVQSVLFSSLKSQNWCPPGATWRTSAFGNIAGYDAIVEYKYQGDTIVLNTPCKLIKGVLNGLAVPVTGMATYTTLPNYRSYVSYEQNSVLYLFNGQSFDTLVNYNASVGDTWRTINPCRSRQTFTVTYKGISSIGNLNLRTIAVNFIDTVILNGTPQLDTNSYTFIERIMSPLVNYKNLMPMYCQKVRIDSNKIDDTDPPWTYFCGYSDNTFTYSPVSSNFCKTTLDIKTKDALDAPYNIRPNPNNGCFKIDLDADSKVSVYNAPGGLVYEEYSFRGGTSDINLGSLPTGIYFLEVRSKTRISYQKFIKE